jgi:putative (di)nucleoside polyphosphate hydrolase
MVRHPSFRGGGANGPRKARPVVRTRAPRNDGICMSDDKPYRPNVGVALFNASGQVLIGRRFRDDGPEIILPGLEWQMPQGGIDMHENPRDAVMRELWEETGVRNAAYLDETDWLAYDFPPFDGPQSHRLAKFRGQRQKWFALRFTGQDDEVDPLTPRNDQPPEFDQWRWERLDRVADLVVPFRREVYREVARNFARFV